MKTKQGIIKARNILTPPNKAVVFLCHLSSFGSTINPNLFDIFMIIGVRINDNDKERKNGMRYLSTVLFASEVFNHTFNYAFYIYCRIETCQIMDFRDIRDPPSHIFKAFLVSIIVGDIDYF